MHEVSYNNKGQNIASTYKSGIRLLITPKHELADQHFDKYKFKAWVILSLIAYALAVRIMSSQDIIADALSQYLDAAAIKRVISVTLWGGLLLAESLDALLTLVFFGVAVMIANRKKEGLISANRKVLPLLIAAKYLEILIRLSQAFFDMNYVLSTIATMVVVLYCGGMLYFIFTKRTECSQKRAVIASSVFIFLSALEQYCLLMIG